MEQQGPQPFDVILAFLNAKSPEEIQALQAQGCDINGKDPGEFDQSALIAAVRYRDLDTVSRILRAGADPNTVDRGGNNPLTYAVQRIKNPEILKLLLAAGTDVRHANESGWTPLHSQCIVECLSACPCSGHTEEHIREIIRLHDLQLAEGVRILLAAGADVEARTEKGWTPLMAAVHAGHMEAARELLNAGADPNAADAEGKTPLIEAAEGKKESVRLLLGAGATPIGKDNAAAQKVLMEAVQRAKPLVIANLHEAGMDVNFRDEKGVSPLEYAIQTGKEKTVKALLEAGADPNVPGSSGRPLLQTTRKDVLAELLRQHGAR